MILSQDFTYAEPWFYNHPYALRCELAPDGKEHTAAGRRFAVKRAVQIFDILFDNGTDAIFFDHYVSDYCTSGDAEIGAIYNEKERPERLLRKGIPHNYLRMANDNLRTLLYYQLKYRHVTVRDIKHYLYEPDDPEYELDRRNRIVCFADDVGFDGRHIAAAQAKDDNHCRYSRISLVSFSNECIFSIYDSRGCDIVFLTQKKMREFYHRLMPFFLKYDAEEMQRRYEAEY